MIQCSSVEGFSSSSSNDLFILGVEGFVIFEVLDLRLCLTPMVFMLMKISEKEVVPFSFYTLGNYSFPSKKSYSKVRHIFKIIDTCQQGEELESLTKSVNKNQIKPPLQKGGKGMAPHQQV